MSITLRLDVPALTKLVESDPQFQFELQRGTMATFMKHTLFKDLPATIKKVIPGAVDELVMAIKQDVAAKAEFEKRVTDALASIEKQALSSREKITLRPAVLEQMREAAQATIDNTMAGALDDMRDKIAERLSERVAIHMAGLDAKIDAALEKATEALVAERVQARITAIKAGL